MKNKKVKYEDTSSYVIRKGREYIKHYKKEAELREKEAKTYRFLLKAVEDMVAKEKLQKRTSKAQER